MANSKEVTTSARPQWHFVSLWVYVTIAWLIALCLLPDPRPLGAPEWVVQTVNQRFSVSEPTARLAATIVLRVVGVGMIGVLLAVTLRQMKLQYAAPLVLAASPLLAIAAKWINFENFPVSPQLQFIVIVAIMGALVGLVLRRSVIALLVLVTLSVSLLAWGASTGISNDLDAAARATGRHVLQHARDLPQGDAGFERLMELAFAYAKDNSRGTDPVFPNKAAILALGVILGEDRVAEVAGRTIDPERRSDRVAIRRRVTVHGRGDLSQHFWVSAALVVLADTKRSWTVGLAKELKDSTPGGSGFSFVDMAANKAGIRFAVVATRDAASARQMQTKITRGVNVSDFVPNITDLPEGMADKKFQSEFGGLAGAETQRMFAEIDKRIESLPALQ